MHVSLAILSIVVKAVLTHDSFDSLATSFGMPGKNASYDYHARTPTSRLVSDKLFKSRDEHDRHKSLHADHGSQDLILEQHHNRSPGHNCRPELYVKRKERSHLIDWRFPVSTAPDGLRRRTSRYARTTWHPYR
jgi:hypothetical protein